MCPSIHLCTEIRPSFSLHGPTIPKRDLLIVSEESNMEIALRQGVFKLLRTIWQ